MKTKIKLIIIFLFIYIFFTSSLFIIIKWENDKNEVLLKYDIERKLSSVNEDLHRGELKEDEDYHDLLAFAFYDNNRRFLEGIGDYPEQLIINKRIPKKGLYIFLDDKNQVLFYRRLRNIAFFMNKRDMRMGHMMSGQRAHHPGGYLYVKINAEDYWNKVHFIRIFRLALLIFLAIVIYLFYLSSLKIHRYRKKIEKHKHLALLGEAARTLTHEIKNPLASIKLQSALLKKMNNNVDMEILDQIEGEVNRLNVLTNKVSDFLKNPKGNPEKIELVSFIEKLIKTFSGKKLKFEYNLESAYIDFDKDRLRSVIENIIINAYESHGDEEEVLIKLNSDKNKIILSIFDRGPGIPLEMQDKIFNAFYTSKIKGSGIGLSISKKFIEASEGQILVHQRPGGGTELRLVFKRIEK